jgi:DNA polymerase/3'-5' exonuclease PolX
MNDADLKRFLEITQHEQDQSVKAARALVRKDLDRRKRAGERGGRPQAEETPLRAKWREAKRLQRERIEEAKRIAQAIDESIPEEDIDRSYDFG